MTVENKLSVHLFITQKANKNIQAKYIKVVAKKLGELPKWHLGYPHDGRSWIFIDEIMIK